ncbi:MAG: hypothetical protein DRQ44_13510 [Gammaproteobacteria bacterium]|nr:MAG: hypothetical protein DRQ44_13510 [Gammaproteobacteria bacterium]
MKIDNQKNTYRIWIRRLTMTIGFTLAIIILIFIPWFDQPDLWLSEFHAMIFLAALFVVISIFNTLKIPYFVSYNDHGDMIVMRYYPLSLFNSKKNSIEIPKQQFVKYELKPFFFGRYQKIILFQHFRNKVVGYPPISLSALDEEDKSRILASLQKYIKN